MSPPFAKYHGAGNDFVLLDDREGRWAPLEHREAIASLCDRHTGIGADGAIFYRVEGDLARMVYYNSDGAPSSFCGNGARCFVAYLLALGTVAEGEPFDFLANDGPHVGVALSAIRSRVTMRPTGRLERLSRTDDRVDTGSPHFVRWVEDLPEGDITAVARAIRYGEAYAKTGINVNYVRATAAGGLELRTYERGVEAETLACGTGVTAAALSFAERLDLTGELAVDVRARGGELSVQLRRAPTGEVSDVWLEGPAVAVFRGELTGGLAEVSRARSAS